MFPNEYAVLTTSRSCAYNQKGSHESNHSYFVINAHCQCVYYACFDSDCRPSELKIVDNVDHVVFSEIEKLFPNEETDDLQSPVVLQSDTFVPAAQVNLTKAHIETMENYSTNQMDLDLEEFEYDDWLTQITLQQTSQ